MTLLLKLEHDEIKSKLHYDIIAETACGSKWNTGQRKRLWNEAFTKQEQHICNRLIRDAKKYHLTTGSPNTLTVRTPTMKYWQRLTEFYITP